MMKSVTSLGVVNCPAASSEMAMPKVSSNLITNSTASRPIDSAFANTYKFGRGDRRPLMISTSLITAEVVHGIRKYIGLRVQYVRQQTSRSGAKNTFWVQVL